MPQYLLEAAAEAGSGGVCSVVCTQPRRIAAISVAERVAEERGEPPPGQLGARVGNSSRLTPSTQMRHTPVSATMSDAKDHAVASPPQPLAQCETISTKADARWRESVVSARQARQHSRPPPRAHCARVIRTSSPPRHVCIWRSLRPEPAAVRTARLQRCSTGNSCANQCAVDTSVHDAQVGYHMGLNAAAWRNRRGCCSAPAT